MAMRALSRPPREKPSVALMLQGGGALGAYHIGAYQALAEHDLHPDWVAGNPGGSEPLASTCSGPMVCR